jgi:hypothetical protein
MARRSKNVPLQLFRDYLSSKGLKVIRTNGGHEIWAGKSIKRPIVIQSHIDPIPEFIVRQSLRTLGIDFEDFQEFLND